MTRARVRRYAGYALFAMGLLAVVAVLGPRIPVDTIPRIVNLPADLDPYLANAEARVPALRPGAERRIVWHSTDRRARTAYAVVYLHGFSASRQETAPLAERVAEALGANLYYARLRGHGRDGAAMAEGTANDWLTDAAEAYAIGERLGHRVVVMGTSTGGDARALACDATRMPSAPRPGPGLSELRVGGPARAVPAVAVDGGAAAADHAQAELRADERCAGPALDH